MSQWNIVDEPIAKATEKVDYMTTPHKTFWGPSDLFSHYISMESYTVASSVIDLT